MIFPFLRGLVPFALVPVTYLLILLNVLIYTFTFSEFEVADKRMDEIIRDDSFLATQGSAFSIMITKEPFYYSETLRTIAKQVLEGEREARRILGALALRNSRFMDHAENYPFEGDEVALADWKEKFKELTDLQERHPSYSFGVSDRRQEPVQWLTYQFTHGGFAHLFWNMFFLVIFGSFVELYLGSLSFLAFYLFSGVFSGFWFSYLSGLSSSPLVGASGAISGLVGLVAFGWLGRGHLRFIYGLLPTRGYYGFAFLPSWVVLIVHVLPDLSGYLAAHRDIGSVAYSAHLGGIVCGAMLAILLRVVFKRSDLFVEQDSSPRSYLAPIVVERPRRNY